MQTALGIRELKARLSHHLRRAQNGTRLTITDRGQPIAILAPVDTAASTEWAHRMAANGRASWSGGKPTGLGVRIPARGRLASRAILEDRR